MINNDFNDYDLGNGTNVTYDTNNLDFNWNELLPTLIVYSVTFILGLTGNILIVFTTYKYRRMKSVTNVFLSSLASSDLILIIVCIPVKVAKLFSYTWEMGAVVCKGIHYMQYVSAICSVLTLTAISIERYYAIVHPMKAKYVCTISQAKRIILVIWILAIILGVPTLKAQLHLPVGKRNESNYCVRGWDDNPTIHKFHELYMFILIFVGPFCIMAFSYGLICWEIWKVIERRSTMTSEQVLSRLPGKYTISQNKKLIENTNTNNSSKTKNSARDDTTVVKQVICMLVTVVVLFAVCWTPMLIDNVLTAYGVLPFMKFGTIKYMSNAFSLMAYFNSCINPIIYGFMSKSFRDSFVQALCLQRRALHERANSYSLRHVSTRASSVKSIVTRTASLK
ncbi:pyroglutamylated RF-amide peptide receptor-like [Diorhabda sublineata]|uniref:pyroglutamylated RF-amide peptide receptor-like n=1 Tax=Diorhabda sublineata TaxID=1163346 RepID=UPI0024E1861B|nr:pyroglutamylated RF-amide peptide receptor-like [Diorhabda sublineata]XP_056646759.1 pyroglutamylated RF-amide peptide receptor-like [Diorhabda sublineata]XP_056646760.1 pyroglutamylated RF-amide peptide receptor-like [Diorhabda sublineata]XP_056646761.1 pyroglutamylated RF-amide peptide receptor-like [Diorhabda sublineata]